MIKAFIINKVAGNGKKSEKILPKIKKLANKNPNIKIYITEGEKDATIIAEALCRKSRAEGKNIDIFACGGDGTLSEVCNGIIGYENVRLGIIPTGSGNDFIRNFGEQKEFLNLKNQFTDNTRKADLIKCTLHLEGKDIIRYCINGINIGFDGNTVVDAHRLRKLPFIAGSFSYLLSVFVNFLKKTGANLEVYVDGEMIHSGKLLLCTASNGRFCGGGIESCPNAEINDGIGDLLIVKNVSRKTFAKAFPAFKKGKLFNISEIENLAIYRKFKKASVKLCGREKNFVIDGEEVKAESLDIEILKNYLRIIVPNNNIQ